MNQNITLWATAEITRNGAPTAVFNTYASALYQYAFRMFHNAVVADQVVGDTFARFLERFPSGGHFGIGLRLELYAIAYDILVTDARYRDFFIPVKTKTLRYAGQSTVKLDIEDQQLFENVQQAIMHDLTNDQRHVVLLRFVEGFSLKETALITGKKVGTVKVIQNRGITALRKALNYEATDTQTITIFIRRMSYA